jgi:hypothetical protein
MSYLSLTEQAITKTPLPANLNLDQIANWVVSVVPSMKSGGVQTQKDTGLVIDHLRFRKHLRDEVIGAALAKSGYKWTVPMHYSGVSMSMGMIELQRAQNAPPPPTSMGPRGKADKDAIKLKADALGILYSANAHNPEVQEKARKDLLALLNQMDDTGPGDPMPGRGQWERERERLAKVRQEILLTAGELGRQVSLQLGPLGVHRARGGFAPTPDLPGAPYRGPNLRNTPRR